MPISTSLLKPLDNLPALNDLNWYTWSKTMTKFFGACGAKYIVDPATTVVEKKTEELDAEVNWIIYGKISEEWQYLVAEEESALASWQALKAHFQKSTMSTRILARRQFHGVVHDPAKPIAIYVAAVLTARSTLKGLGHEPTDTETADVMLMNLDSSFHTVRTTILTSKDEPSLATIKSILLGSSSDTVIKSEPSSFANAANQVYSSGRKNYGPVRSGGSSNGGGGGYGSREDEKGFRWCDPTNENHCHRCGRQNHISARCIHDMPQNVKDWVMAGPSRYDHGNFATDISADIASAAQSFPLYSDSYSPDVSDEDLSRFSSMLIHT